MKEDSLLKKIDGYIYNENFRLAVKELKNILKKESNNVEINEKLGHVYELMDQYDLAIEIFNKVVRLNPQREESYHDLGNMYKMKRLYDRAISDYKKALSINPNRTSSICGVGFCMMKKGEFRKAIEEFENAIKIMPKDIEAYKNLSELYVSLDRYDEVKKIWVKLKELNAIKKDIKVTYFLIKLELLKNHRKELGLAKDLRVVVSDIYKSLNSGRYGKKDLKTILELLKNDFLEEGRYLRGTGDEKLAILKYQSVISLDPCNEEAMNEVYLSEKFLHSSEKPYFCAVSIVFKCMLRCRMCRIWENNVVDELSIESWKGVIDDLAGFMDENRTINFAGGEPLLKDGLIELIEYSNKKGFKPAICTNAWLIDEEMAKRLVDSGLDIVAISLDSLNEKTHDYLRGAEGSYKRAMDAIGYLNKYNKDNKIRVHVQPIISEVNIEDLIDLTHWVNRHEGLGDITFLAIIQPPHTNSDYQEWYTKEEFKELWPKDKGKINAVMDELIRLKMSDKVKSYKIGNQVFQLQAYKEYLANPLEFYKKEVQCNIGTQFINIHTNGDVKLCHYSDIIVGNLTKQRIEDIWNSALTNSVRDKIKVCNKKCHQILNCMKDENPYINKVRNK